MGLYLGGHIIGRIFVSEILGAYFLGGLIFRGAYYQNFTVFYLQHVELLTITSRSLKRFSFFICFTDT